MFLNISKTKGLSKMWVIILMKKANVFSSCGVNICYAFISGAKKLCQMIDKKSIYFTSCNKMAWSLQCTIIVLLVSAKCFADLISCAPLEPTSTFQF